MRVDADKPPPSLRPTATAMRNKVLDVEGDGGSLSLYIPTSSVLHGVVRGHLSRDMAERWIATIQPRLQKGVLLAGFHDWERMTSYESSARYALTKFLGATYRQQPAHILVASRLVAMGVSAASLTLAIAGVKLTSYNKRDVFERALAEALETPMMPPPSGSS